MTYVLVGVDGSPDADSALDAAVGQATYRDIEVRVVHVVAMPVFSGYEFDASVFEQIREAGERTVSAAIATLIERHDGSLPVKVTGDVVMGHAGTQILRAAAQDDGAELIVVGSRGFGAVKSVLLGSVATYLTHHITCPLLIVPGPTTPSSRQ